MQCPTVLRSIRLVAPAATAIAIFAPFLCLASAAASAGSPQAPPATAATPAPTALPASSAQDPLPAADRAAASNAKKSKKIWTNEDVPDMGRPVSVVGDGRDAKNKSAAPKPADPQYVATVRKQLEKLRGQLADADKELATLKNFNDGESVGTSDRELHKGYNSQPILQQMANLEIKKKDLQAKIDTLLDEARQKGVEPGQLR
jgi:hypothetical protein